MIKVLGIVFITLILVVFLKDTNREFSVFITIVSAIIIFTSMSKEFSNVFLAIKEISSKLESVNSYISLMLKILGVSLLAQFVTDLCRDSGEGALATQTEIASKVLMLVMTMPLFTTVVNIVLGLLK